MKKKDAHINQLIWMENNQAIGQENQILIAKHFAQQTAYLNAKNGIVHLVNNNKLNHKLNPPMKILIVGLSVEKDHLAQISVEHGDVQIVFHPPLLIYHKHVKLPVLRAQPHAQLPLHHRV